jgi:hypothetical protein
MRLITLTLVTAAVLAAGPTLAQDGASRTTPPSQPNAKWTEQQMRAAQPAMPVIRGKPPGERATPAPRGPIKGEPGQAPQTQPDASK